MGVRTPQQQPFQSKTNCQFEQLIWQATGTTLGKITGSRTLRLFWSPQIVRGTKTDAMDQPWKATRQSKTSLTYHTCHTLTNPDKIKRSSPQTPKYKFAQNPWPPACLLQATIITQSYQIIAEDTSWSGRLTTASPIWTYLMNRKVRIGRKGLRWWNLEVYCFFKSFKNDIHWHIFDGKAQGTVLFSWQLGL